MASTMCLFVRLPPGANAFPIQLVSDIGAGAATSASPIVALVFPLSTQPSSASSTNPRRDMKTRFCSASRGDVCMISPARATESIGWAIRCFRAITTLTSLTSSDPCVSRTLASTRKNCSSGSSA